jgi:RNA recognition motif-containing protein
MMLNGGKIKGVQVTLLLSSRAEMQKVIEKARNASTNAFMSKAPPVTQQPPAMSASAIASQFAQKAPEMSVIPPQPPVISLTNFLTQSMQQQQIPAAHLNMLPAYQTMPPVIKNTAIPPMGLASNSAAAYANYYATMMDPSAVNYMNQMPAAIKNPLETPSVSYNKDPRARRSNSIERNTYRRQRSRSPDSDRDRENGSKRRTRFSERTDAPKMSAMPPNMSNTAAYSIPPPSNNIWDAPPPQLFNSANNNNSLPPTRHYQTENKSNGSSSSGSFGNSLGNIGSCVKVSNVDSATFYSDLRKFFAGLPIGNNDIKFVNDLKGERTGVVLIRFLSSDSKKKALTKSMWQLKSTQVMITSISEEDFENGFVKSNVKKNEDRGGERYDRNDRNERYRSRSSSRERDNNRNFNYRGEGNRGGFNNSQNNNQREREGNFRNDRNFKNFKSENRYEKPKEYVADENYTVLMVDDIPRTANEPDICEAFPNIKSIVIDRYTAYVKFTTHEAAKVTLENRFIHNIRNKRVFLYAASDAQFNDLARELGGKFDNPETMVDNENLIDEDTNHSSNSNSRDRENSRNSDQKPPSVESRDPRQRNFNNNSNDRFNGQQQQQQQQNLIKTDCVIMKNMETDTTIEDVETFYKDIGIYKMRVHILLDKRGKKLEKSQMIFKKKLIQIFSSPGNPCGDCFVEFKYPNDSHRAISKNNQMLKNNRVQIMLIPREQVDAVLSSFGGGGDDNGRPQNRRQQDWAPPSDFGAPGCVVMLSNLSYRASIEDILEEFREFDLNPDQIIRRFNDMG